MQLYPTVKKEAGITVAEKPKVIAHGIIVCFSPVVADQGGDKQQQRALWHVKVGDQA